MSRTTGSPVAAGLSAGLASDRAGGPGTNAFPNIGPFGPGLSLAMEESFRDGTDIQIRERSLETSTSANT